MNLIDGWMPYSTKHLREIKMTNENNQLLDEVSIIDKSFEKIEQNSKKVNNQLGLIWLTILGYIIYLEFFK